MILAENTAKSKKYKFWLGRFKADIRKIFFTGRVEPPWNSLPWDPVKSLS